MNKIATVFNHRKRNILIVLVLVLAALCAVYVWYQSTGFRGKTTPPEYRKISSVTGIEITIAIREDATGLYFEHNGERLSSTNRIRDLMPGTEYMFTVSNGSTVKQGIFIPALQKSVVVDPENAVTTSLTFTNPGTYFFLGNTFQTGWDDLKSGFDVATDVTN